MLQQKTKPLFDLVKRWRDQTFLSQFIQLPTLHGFFANRMTMEVRADSREGRLLATLKVPMTGGDNRWVLVSSEIERITGVHDLYFICKGNQPGRLMYFDYWMFSK